ncbi:hypothetical protein [Streptomyces mirabilis]|uniref:hypothetical protein n=1 Tax=Streptomyces mirabilis TaxID=68239 RepID=UPI0033B04B26
MESDQALARGEHLLAVNDVHEHTRLACRNVALTRAKIDTWGQEIDRGERRLAPSPPLPPLVQHRLVKRMEQISPFLAAALPESM